MKLCQSDSNPIGRTHVNGLHTGLTEAVREVL